MNLFNTIQLRKPKKNFFDLSHDVKLSLNMGDLVPVMALECVPGDQFTIGTESLIRFAPLMAPVMHRFDVYTHYFFVPNRIVWPNFEKFINKTKDKTTQEVPAAPYFIADPGWVSQSGYAEAGTLWDYLGLPNNSVTQFDGEEGTKVNAIPFAAYQRIWHEYYRDQNLIDIDPEFLVDGDNNTTTFGGKFASYYRHLRKRAWEHDYFTAALPFAQKGESVEVPMGSVALGDMPVIHNGSGTTLEGTPEDVTLEGGLSTLPNTEMYVPSGQYGEVNAGTINDLRKAYKLQEWLERNARGGTRYIETILAHFGVRSSDKRLNRPEYITGAKSPVTVSEVLQNSSSEESGTPQGNMAGHAVSVQAGKYGKYFCEEHGYIIGIMSILPKTAYYQGIPRHFSKLDSLDYYWPSFANLGEQEIKNKELYYADNGLAEGTFGYIPRYAEYKYMPSRVAGDFTTSLEYWHMARKFETTPSLNKAFVEANPGRQIFAVQDPTVDSIYAHVYNKVKAFRPMPKFGTPML